MRRRFFVDRFDSGSASILGETAEHLGRVLRAEPGQLYELSDGRSVWLGRIETVANPKRGESRIDFALIEPVAIHENPQSVQLFISLVKFDRFEWCLEKATELGASEITPLAAARSDKALVAAAQKRALRWKKIAVESAQQARRLRPPEILAARVPRGSLCGLSGGAQNIAFRKQRCNVYKREPCGFPWSEHQRTRHRPRRRLDGRRTSERRCRWLYRSFAGRQHPANRNRRRRSDGDTPVRNQGLAGARRPSIPQ